MYHYKIKICSNLEQVMCKDCSGQGKAIPKEDICTECKGKKVIEEKKLLEVTIKPGMIPGQRFYFKKAASEMVFFFSI